MIPMVTVILPSVLAELTRGNREVNVYASTVGEMLERLETMFPGLKDRVCDEQGAFRGYVNVFLNEENLAHNGAHHATLKETDVVHILPSIAGGAR